MFIKVLALLMITVLNLTPILTWFNPQWGPTLANAECQNASSAPSTRLTNRVGGVALDQAAKFLADMSEMTGAYYDADKDRIVFVGKKGATTAPKFDKDDLAVAIRTVIFEGMIPRVSLEFGENTEDGKLYVIFDGDLEDTKFGKVMLDADYKLKTYVRGQNPDGSIFTSSVPGYKSYHDRFQELGFDGGESSSTRFWLTPQLISLKRDDINSAFVFQDTKMQVRTEPSSDTTGPNETKAANDFVQQFTESYDLYTQESSIFFDLKQLGKITAVIKWIADSGITTDFHWARDYAPKKVPTPEDLPQFPKKTMTSDDGTFIRTVEFSGGANFETANEYLPDNTGDSSTLKNASQSIPTTKEDITWTFTKDGQNFEAVAVTADAFRTLGSYNSSVTDLSFPMAGDLNSEFKRAYSSYSGGQYGVGRGWNIYPAQLMPTDYHNNPIACSGLLNPPALGFFSQAGGWESFSFKDCTQGYVPDDPVYHSKMIHNPDDSYTVILKNQIQYNFDSKFKLVNIRDKNGNLINYNYDSSGKLSSIADSKGHQIAINYGTFSGQTLISSISDWSGRTVNYTYDDQGNLLTVKDPNNGITTYTYDTNFKLTSITDRNNQLALTNTYTDEAKIATQKDAANITHTYAYDKVNRKITTTDNQTPSRTQKTAYDAKARILEQTDPLLKTVKYTYGVEFAPLTITDKNNNKITNTYDTNGNVTSTTYPDTKKVTYQYDIKNRLIKITDERYSIPGKDTTYTYDGTGNLTQTNEAGQITGYTYDTTGEMLTLTDPLTNKTTWTRDSFGNPLTEIDATNFTTIFTYDAIGRLIKKTDADAKVFSYTHDNNGNLLTQTDAIGTTTSVYDKENRLQKVTLPDTAATEFTYNASDSLIAVKDPALNLSSYGYNAYQNLISQQDALNKITTYNYDALNRQTQSTTPLGKVSKWTYDPNGNIVSRIDANNKTTQYQYDAFNRLTKITYPDLKTVSFTYDNRGNQTKMVDASGTSTFTYDEFDRLKTHTNPLGLKISYEYDSASNLKKLIYPDNRAVVYTYDGNNRISAVTDWNGKQTTYTYNKNGLVASRTYPNTIKTVYSYDAANRLMEVVHTKGTAVFAKYTYERDIRGNIIKATEQGSANDLTTYTFDVLGRVTGAVYDYPDESFAYSYDKVGNQTRKTQHKFVNPDITDYTYDNDGRLLKGGIFSYLFDNNGNRIQKKETGKTSYFAYKYDFENRLVDHSYGTSKYTYKYDGLGNRIERSYNGSLKDRYATDISGPLSRLLVTANWNTNLREWYIYGVGPISEGGYSYSTRNYYLEDGLGNIRLVTNYFGSSSSINEYDPFGGIRWHSGGNPVFRFQGQQLLEEPFVDDDLYFLRARYYDPNTGTFVSRDPVKGYVTQPQTQNPYSYAINNPINYSDPSGKDAFTYIDPLASVPFFGGHTGLYYQDANGNWYKSDLGLQKSDSILPVSGQGNYNIQKMPDNFDPSSQTKIAGVIPNPLTQYYETTSQQDAAIAGYVTQEAGNINTGQKKYNLLTNNCKQNSYNALQSAGVNANDFDYQPSPMGRLFLGF